MMLAPAILFSVWVTFTERYWVSFRERRRKDLNENHVAGPANRASLLFRLSVSRLGCGARRHRRLCAEQGSAQGEFFLSRPVRQKPILPDTDESAGQDVKQEAPDELDRIERHRLRLVAVGIVLPQERHLAVFYRQDSAVGNCDPVRVASQILQNLLRAAERWFHMDNPFTPGGAAAQCFERTGCVQRGHLSVELQFAVLKRLPQVIQENVSESAAQNLHGQKE